MENLELIFNQQRAYKLSNQQSDYRQRIVLLKLLKDVIIRHENLILEALNLDLRKNEFEAAVTEIYFVYAEIDFAINNLKKWMKPKRAKSSRTSFLSKNAIIYEPKGTCLIISPWNYPFQLTLSPLVSALAAGNTTLVKPSEISSHSANVIETILNKNFDPAIVYCAIGGQDISEFLLKLPFDHIFFTGSTQVGKIVMQAAAKHLSSVTLELGGKSPVLIDPSANISDAAEKIAWGKLINAGQTCIAPDYILLHDSQKAEFIQQFKNATLRMLYDNDGKIDPNCYGKIINASHLNRLKLLIEDAVMNGAEVAWVADNNLADSIPPTLISVTNVESRIMEEEIFGPLLPIITYSEINEALHFIRSRPKPLALYIFSNDSKKTNYIIQNTTAGGTCVNDVIVHVSNPHLPFGGVNQSGVGSSHGYYGFKTFSHERSVMYQSRIPITRLVYPPYSNKGWILKFLRRWM